MTRSLSRALVTLTAVLTAFAFLTAILGAGTIYYFCPAMNRVMATDCCLPDAPLGDGVDRGLPTASQPCCEAHAAAALSEGLYLRSERVLNAPLVAVMSATEAWWANGHGSAKFQGVWHGGVDPPRPSPHRYRLLIQVFLI